MTKFVILEKARTIGAKDKQPRKRKPGGWVETKPESFGAEINSVLTGEQDRERAQDAAWRKEALERPMLKPEDVKTSHDVHIYRWQQGLRNPDGSLNPKSTTIDSFYHTLKTLHGEKAADVMMRELEVRSWQPIKKAQVRVKSHMTKRAGKIVPVVGYSQQRKPGIDDLLKQKLSRGIPTDVVNAKVGYNTDPYWAPLREIKNIEVGDRGNAWFNDRGLNLNEWEATWVTIKPEDAVGYALLADELGTKKHKEAMKHPLDYVGPVNLTGGFPVLDDGDEGWLFIRKKQLETKKTKKWVQPSWLKELWKARVQVKPYTRGGRPVRGYGQERARVAAIQTAYEKKIEQKFGNLPNKKWFGFHADGTVSTAEAPTRFEALQQIKAETSKPVIRLKELDEKKGVIGEGQAPYGGKWNKVEGVHGKWLSEDGKWKIESAPPGFMVMKKVGEGLGNFGYKKDWLHMHDAKSLEEAKSKAGNISPTVLTVGESQAEYKGHGPSWESVEKMGKRFNVLGYKAHQVNNDIVNYSKFDGFFSINTTNGEWEQYAKAPSGRTSLVDEGYDFDSLNEHLEQVKKALGQTPNAPELFPPERGYRAKTGIKRNVRPVRTNIGRKMKHHRPLNFPVTEGATKSMIDDNLYVILQKGRVQVKPYSRRGRPVKGYAAERRERFTRVARDAYEEKMNDRLVSFLAKPGEERGVGELPTPYRLTDLSHHELKPMVAKHGFNFLGHTEKNIILTHPDFMQVDASGLISDLRARGDTRKLKVFRSEASYRGHEPVQEGEAWYSIIDADKRANYDIHGKKIRGTVGEEQEEYGRKLTTESAPQLRTQGKIAKQIEQNQTTAVKFLRPELKRSVNNLLHGLGTYHNEIPLKQVFDILNQYGLTALQEDGTEWEGFLLGRDGHIFLNIAPLGSKRLWVGPQYKDKIGQTQVVPDTYVYDAVKNTSLNMSWHKFDESGRYEILAYLS